MKSNVKEDGIWEMKKELGRIIEALSLDELPKTFLKSRWLDQLIWVERASKKNQHFYYLLRLSCILGGVTIPALVSLTAGGKIIPWVHSVTVILSLIVAVSAAVEEFFHFGERWRHYRSLAEHLKGEGWSFFQLSGIYGRYDSHADAYLEFAGRIEEALQKEVAVYIAKMTKAKESEESHSNVFP